MRRRERGDESFARLCVAHDRVGKPVGAAHVSSRAELPLRIQATSLRNWRSGTSSERSGCDGIAGTTAATIKPPLFLINPVDGNPFHGNVRTQQL